MEKNIYMYKKFYIYDIKNSVKVSSSINYKETKKKLIFLIINKKKCLFLIPSSYY